MCSVFCCSLQILFSPCSFYLSQGKIFFSWDGSSPSHGTDQLFAYTSMLLSSRNAIPCKDAATRTENLSKDIFLSVLFFKGLESKVDKCLFCVSFFLYRIWILSVLWTHSASITAIWCKIKLFISRCSRWL